MENEPSRNHVGSVCRVTGSHTVGNSFPDSLSSVLRKLQTSILTPLKGKTEQFSQTPGNETHAFPASIYWAHQSFKWSPEHQASQDSSMDQGHTVHKASLSAEELLGVDGCRKGRESIFLKSASLVGCVSSSRWAHIHTHVQHWLDSVG